MLCISCLYTCLLVMCFGILVSVYLSRIHDFLWIPVWLLIPMYPDICSRTSGPVSGSLIRDPCLCLLDSGYLSLVSYLQFLSLDTSLTIQHVTSKKLSACLCTTCFACMRPGPVVIKKMMSPCSIWQGLWAAAQEKRYLCVLCVHKRGG
jgi:hypothetical protein